MIGKGINTEEYIEKMYVELDKQHRQIKSKQGEKGIENWLSGRSFPGALLQMCRKRGNKELESALLDYCVI